jgi:hypothetical protein
MHNIMFLFEEHGMSQQEAYSQIDILLRERIRDGYIALLNIPMIREQVDIETQKYIQACQDIVVAALNWRYFFFLLFTFVLKLIIGQLQIRALPWSSCRESEGDTAG